MLEYVLTTAGPVLMGVTVGMTPTFALLAWRRRHGA